MSTHGDRSLGAASLIKITSNNIANVNLVGASIVDVNNVAAKLVEISNVSTNMASVQSAHTNMAAIIAATQATAAQTAKGLAETARDKAQDWAEEAEGTPVGSGAVLSPPPRDKGSQQALLQLLARCSRK